MKPNVIAKISIAFFMAALSGCGKKEEEEKPASSAQKTERRNPDHRMDGKMEMNERDKPSSEDEDEFIGLGGNERLQRILMKEPTPEWLVRGPIRRTNLIKSEKYDYRSHQKTSSVRLGYSRTLDVNGTTITLPDDFKPNGVSEETRKGLVVLKKNMSSRVYQIEGESLFWRDDIPLPQFNFGERPRWYVSRWQWLDEETLVGSMLMDDVENGLISDARLYTYNIESKTLRPVELPTGVVDPLDPNIEILSVEDGVVSARTATGVHHLDMRD